MGWLFKKFSKLLNVEKSPFHHMQIQWLSLKGKVLKMAYVLVLVWASSACFHARAGNNDHSPIGKEYELDLTTQSVVHSIDPGIAAPQTKKFVQIEVTKVINPKKVPLSFTVHYQPVEGRKFFLGIFSLFPPDNPGNFLIATQGKLQRNGVLIVSLMPSEEWHDLDILRVGLHISLKGD